MTLRDIQRRFRDHLLAGKDAPLAGVAPEREKGLAVYRNNYCANLIASLRDTYEKTWTWLGDDAFERAAQDHVANHAPQSWTLNNYGGDFAQTLSRLHPGDPEIAELAWLDWNLRRAFDGPDAAIISAEALTEIDWDSAVLTFLPTLSVKEVRTNCAAIWGALNDGVAPPAAALLPQPAAIRVWRSDLTPKYRSIENFEHRALVLALAGASFASLCNLLVENGDRDRAVECVGTALASWLQDGLISGAGPAAL